MTKTAEFDDIVAAEGHPSVPLDNGVSRPLDDGLSMPLEAGRSAPQEDGLAADHTQLDGIDRPSGSDSSD